MTFIRHPQEKIQFDKGRCGSTRETEKDTFKVHVIIYFSSDEPQKNAVF